MSNSGVGVVPLPDNDNNLYDIKKHSFFIAAGLSGKSTLEDAWVLEILEC